MRTPSVRVRIRLVKRLADDKVGFEQSHFIRTPAQADPYTTNQRWAETEVDALEAAIRTLTRECESTIKQGHPPDASWLVENPNFQR